MQNINDIFMERTMIMSSITYECIDPLDYLCEAIDILLEDDSNNNNQNNKPNNTDSLKQDDRRIKFDIKKTISNMVKVLIEWFGKLKDTMSNFFKSFRNINHKKNIKKIFTDPDKLNKKVKVYNYVNMQTGITAVEKMMSEVNGIFRNYNEKNPDMQAYKNEVAQKLGLKAISGADIKSKVYSCFIRNNEKIKIRINELNEQIMASYLIEAERSVNSIDKWRDRLKQDVLIGNSKIERSLADGDSSKEEANKKLNLLKAHTSILEKMAVYTMKCIKKAFSDFNKIVNKGNGTMDNLDEEREQIEKAREQRIKEREAKQNNNA